MPRRPTRPWQRPPRPTRAGRRVARTRRLDLHGYDVLTACDLALLVVREAYENGYEAVELVHGARDVVERVAPGEGRGAIKFELRAMLQRGQFDAYVQRGLGQLLEGEIFLPLRNNPRPRPERWSSLPPPRRG